jgi:hypothetical protein
MREMKKVIQKIFSKLYLELTRGKSKRKIANRLNPMCSNPPCKNPLTKGLFEKNLTDS